MKTKIFCDIAEIDLIKKFNKKKIVRGFTTNPTLMRKAGAKDYKSYSKKILRICDNKPVSLEVFADDFDEIERQARKISTWGKNVFVKIPITNTKSEKSKKLIKKLSDEGIKLNITAIFTESQISDTISSLNPEVNSIISIFAGRIADTGIDPIPYMMFADKLIDQNKNIKTLWASTRQIYSIFEADKIGCNIITVPSEMLNKLIVLGKDLDKYSLDTVKQFYEDASASKYKI